MVRQMRTTKKKLSGQKEWLIKREISNLRKIKSKIDKTVLNEGNSNQSRAANFLRVLVGSGTYEKPQASEKKRRIEILLVVKDEIMLAIVLKLKALGTFVV